MGTRSGLAGPALSYLSCATPRSGSTLLFAAVDHLKLRIDEHNAAWQDFFERCGVKPMEVVYEELVEDYRETVLWLLDGMGISVPENFAVAEPRMRRQADELSEEWVRLYDARAAAKTVQKG
jgi:LPS sulfotransferase NodH